MKMNIITSHHRSRRFEIVLRLLVALSLFLAACGGGTPQHTTATKTPAWTTDDRQQTNITPVLSVDMVRKWFIGCIPSLQVPQKPAFNLSQVWYLGNCTSGFVGIPSSENVNGGVERVNYVEISKMGNVEFEFLHSPYSIIDLSLHDLRRLIFYAGDSTPLEGHMTTLFTGYAQTLFPKDCQPSIDYAYNPDGSLPGVNAVWYTGGCEQGVLRLLDREPVYEANTQKVVQYDYLGYTFDDGSDVFAGHAPDGKTLTIPLNNVKMMILFIYKVVTSS